MRSISALSTVMAAAVLVLGLVSCDNADDNGAKTTSTTASTTHATTTNATTDAPSPTTAAQTTPQTPPTTPPVAEPATISCGVGPFGLAVFAVTTKGDSACPTALAVMNAYAVQSELWDIGFVVPVTVGTGIWDCQERIGAPNPYQECVSRDNPTEKARLSS